MLKPYYQESDNIKIYCGDVLEVLKSLDDESVNTIITSPPYWGLRDYGEDTKTIWDGDPSCEHNWGSNIPIKYHKSGETNPGKEGYTKDAGAWGQSAGQFCSKCGAWYGQLGLEPTLDLYISHLLQVTAELKRVLRKDGIMFWNQGDSYWGSGKEKDPKYGKGRDNQPSFTKGTGYQAKCMLLQNYRLILKMIDEQGWILRNNIIWNKPNHMPTSVKDRFANGYEPVFMLTKNSDPIYYYNIKTGLMADRKAKDPKENIDWEWRECPNCKGTGKIEKEKETKIEEEMAEEKCKRCKGTGKIKYSFWRALDYWFDLDAVRLPHTDIRDYERHAPFNYRVREAKKGHNGIVGVKSTQEEMLRYNKKGQKQSWAKETGQSESYGGIGFDPKGKNPGDVWVIPTQPFPEAHFATFPEKLVKPMILVGCPQWVCKKCGKARVRIVELGDYSKKPKRGTQPSSNRSIGAPHQSTAGGMPIREKKTVGWTDCDCNAGWDLGVLLDPFMGAGTVGLVAKKLGRGFIGIDIKKEYCDMAVNRIKNITPNLPFE